MARLLQQPLLPHLAQLPQHLLLHAQLQLQHLLLQLLLPVQLQHLSHPQPRK